MTNILITVYSAAKAMGVPAALLVAVCTHETGLKNLTNYNDGNSDSLGVCQVKIATAQLMRDTYHIHKKVTVESLLNPKDNSYWAALYLKDKLNTYNGNWYKAVSAYNMGTYKERRKKPGYAINHQYILNVRSYLPPELKHKLLYPEGAQ